MQKTYRNLLHMCVFLIDIHTSLRTFRDSQEGTENTSESMDVLTQRKS